MDRRNVIGLDGTIHEGLFNGYTGFLIDLACEKNRYAAVEPYTKFNPGKVTDAPLTCAGCVAANVDGADHPADVAHRYAAIVLADADRRGFIASRDHENLRIVFERLAPDAGELRTEFKRMAEGVYPASDNYRTNGMFALVAQHLDDMLTERATAPVPEGTRHVMVAYKRWTGGEILAPVTVGDRLRRYSPASGWFNYGTVLEVIGYGSVLVREDDWVNPRRWDLTRDEASVQYTKMDRPLVPATV